MPACNDVRIVFHSFFKSLVFLSMLVLGMGFSHASTAQVTASPNPSTTGSFTVSWPNASGNDILVSQVLNGNSTVVYEGTGSSLFLSGKVDGDYTYTAIDFTDQDCDPFVGCFPSLIGNVAVTVALAVIPSTPSGLTSPASDTNGSYTVSWSASSGASTYTLQRQLNSGAWSTIQNTSSLSKSESGLANGSYGYRVRACGGAGCSSYSSTKTTSVLSVPGVPGAISTPASNSSGDYTVSWGAASGSVTSYTLQERANSGSWSTIQSSSARSFSVTDKVNGSFDYRTRACNGSGCSAYTAVKTTQVSIFLTIAASPNPSTTGTVTLSWSTSVLNANSYSVYDVTGGGKIFKSSTTGGSVVLSGLDNGTYTFLVEAVIYAQEIGTITIPAGEVIVTVAVAIPPVPGGLTTPASDTNGSYTVSWNSASGASTYTLQRQLNSGAWTTIQNTSAVTKAESGLANGTYGYRVRACNSGGCSGYAATQTTTVLLVPGVPGAISTPSSSVSGDYTVSWTAASGTVTSYTLQEQVDGGSWISIQSNSALSRVITDNLNGAYGYRVRACNGSGCSGYTAVQTTQVTILVTISASPNPSTTGNVTLSWDDSVLNADSYSVYDVTGGGRTFIVSVTAGSAALTGLSNGTYDFLVEGVITAQEIGTLIIPMGEVNVTVAVVAPTVPTGLTTPATDTNGSYTVSWNSASGASTYTLQRQLNSGAWTTIQNASAVSKAESGLGNGTYGYRVRACNSGGCSGYAATQTTTVLLVPGVPGAISTPATTTSGVYTVSWGAAASGSVDSYTLQERVDAGGWTTVQSSSALSFGVTDKLNGTFDYRVNACNGSGCSAYTAVQTTQVTILATISASPNPSTTGAVTLSWDTSVVNADTYSVYDITGGGRTILSTVSTGSSTLDGLSDGTYTFLVEATITAQEIGTLVIPLGESIVTVAIVVAVPSLTVPATDTDGSFSVSWNATTGASYTLERQYENGTWSTLYAGEQAQLDEVGLSTGQYGYRVNVCLNGTCSAASSVESIEVVDIPGIPGPITTPITSTNGEYVVSWSSATGIVDTYTLEERFTSSGEWLVIQDTNALSSSLSGQAGGNYFYRVKACNVGACSDYTAEQSTLVYANATITATPNPSTTGTVSLSWEAVVGAVNYHVYDISGSTLDSLGFTQTLSITLDDQSHGDHTYQVWVVMSSQETGSFEIPIGSVEVSVILTAGIPSTISSPANDDDGNYTVSWLAPAVGSVDSYRLQEQANASGWVLIDSPVGLSSAIEDRINGSYQYRVAACNSEGCSEYSSAISTTIVSLVAPGVPGPITGPNTSDSGNYSLAWTAATGAVSSYLIQEQVNGDTWSDIQNADLLSVDVLGKGEGTYGYQVAACNSSGCGAFTAVKTVAVSSASSFPGVPGGISGPAIDEDGDYTITWNESSGTISHYALEEQKDGAGWVILPDVSGTSVLLTSRADGNYLYRVKACDGELCSDYGDELLVVVLQVLGPVESITAPATNSSGSYTVSWGEASGSADTYQLEERVDGIEWLVVQGTDERSKIFSEKADASYEYRVAACNASGCSEYSEVVTTVVSAAQIPSERDDESDAPAAKPVVGSGSITASERVGSIDGQFRVNESGAASYSASIKVGAGTAGVAPQLAINYSSQGGSGLLGKGWSLSGLSSISRCRQTLGQDGAAKAITWSAEDRFCLDGQRLVVVSGNYGDPGSTYKTETDSFVTVTAIGDVLGSAGHFSVEGKDGSTSLYGESADAKVLTSDSHYILSWSQNEFRDSVGNPIQFVYKNGGRGQRIDRINYAYGVSDIGASPGAYVQFNYDGDDRSDSRETYVSGYLFPQKVILNSVTSYTDGDVVRHYHMEYMVSDLNTVPKLEYLHECSEFVSTPSLSSCLNPTEFTWLDDLDGFNHQLPVENFTGSSSEGLYGWKPADINGDGMMDIVWLQWKQRVDDIKFQMRYMLSGDSELKETAFTNKLVAKFRDVGIHDSLKLEIIDYNADGRQDVMVYNSRVGGWRVYLSTLMADGEWRLSGSAITLGITSSDIFLADVNSDGLVDLIYIDRLDEHKMFVRLLEHDPSRGLGSKRYYHFGPPIDLEFNPIIAGTEEGKISPVGTLDLFVYSFSSAGDYNGDGTTDFYLDKTSAGCVEILGCDNHHQGWTVTLHSDTENNITGEFIYRGELVGLLPNDDETIANVFSGMQSFDINGDGLGDVMYRKRRYDLNDDRSWFYRMNTGGEYGAEQLLLHVPSDDEGRYAMQFVDYNQDGAVDIVWADTDSGSLKALYGDGISGFSSENVIHTISASGSGEHAHILMDMNGDARPDYLHVWDNKLQVAMAQGSLQPGGVITSITNGLGGVTDIAYGSLAANGNYERLGASTSDVHICLPDDLSGNTGSLDCTDYTYSLTDPSTFYKALNGDWDLPEGSHGFGRDKPVLELNSPMAVVTRVTGSAPVVGDPNATSSISYHYGEAKIQASGRGMLGFQAIKTIDEQTGIETTSTYRQDYPFIGYPLTTVVRGPRQVDADGVVLSTAQNIWKLKNFNGVDTPKPYQPYIAESVQVSYGLQNGGLLQGAALQTVTTTSSYDDYGNPIAISVTTEGDGEGGGDTLVKTTTNQYGSNVWEQEKGRLSRTDVTTTRNTASETRSSTFTYYESGDLTGLLHTEVIEPGDPQSLTNTYEYDLMGNKAKITRSGADVVSRYTRSEYDVLGRYIDRSYNSLGHLVSSVVTRNHLSAITEVNDINGVKTFTEYDRFGVQYLGYSETGAGKITLRSWCASGCGLVGAVFKLEERSVDSALANKITLFDVLGRKIRESGLLLDGSYSHVDIGYDELGRVIQQSEPHTGTPSNWTINEYDLLGRPTAISAPADTGVGSVITYDGYTTVTTNDQGQSKTEVKNALGELVEVMDHLGGRVSYEYDPLGNLDAAVSLGSIIDTHSIRVEMDYDAFGRKITMNDPDKGFWEYAYNAFGELILQTDAKLQASTMSYDTLARMITRVDRLANGVVEGDTYWFYDTAANALGQLDSVVDLVSDYAQFHQFDSFGRPLRVVTSHDDSGAYDYTTQTVYDQYSRVKRRYDALDMTASSGGSDGSGIINHYNSYGHLSYITDVDSNDEIYRVSEQNARGQITSVSLGNGSTSSFDYDTQTGRLRGQYSQLLIGQQIQSIEYDWDSSGNLEYRHNTSGSRDITETFGYDGLNRLETSTLSGPDIAGSVNTVTYNAIGNIMSKTGVGIYTYGQNSAGPHAVSSTTDGVSYNYDANGNLISDTAVGNLGGRTLSYTSFDKPNLITKGNHSIAFKYGSDRSRYLRTDINSADGSVKETRYLGSVERISTQGSDTVEWKRTINGVAIYTTTTNAAGELQEVEKAYLYKDHLGSIDFITDANGTVVQEMSFDAWGQRRDVENWSALDLSSVFSFDTSETTRGFTGHEMLDEVGLVHMNGRIYDARLGRFMQADPFVDGVSNTQGYNRYSYLANNPLNGTDPTGFFKLRQWVGLIVAVVGGVICGPACAQVGWQVVVLGAVSGAAGAAANGGNIFQGAILGAITAGAFSGVAGIDFSGLGAFAGVAKFAAFGVVGGITSTISGGNFGHGFMSAGIGGMVGGSRLSSTAGTTNQLLGRLLARMVISGTVSKLTGGKFANGAGSVAFSWAVSAATADDVLITGKKKDAKSMVTEDTIVVKPEINFAKPHNSAGEAKDALNTGILDAKTNGNSNWEYGGITVQKTVDGVTKFYNSHIVTSENGDFIAWNATYLLSINATTPLIMLHHYHPSGFDAIYKTFSDGDMSTYHYLKDNGSNLLQGVYMVDKRGVRSYKGGKSNSGISCRGDVASC